MEARILLSIVFAGLLVSSSAFVITVGESRQLEPVSFEDSIRLGMTDVDTLSARAAGYEIPKAEVFFTEYRYVVGYYGVSSMVDDLNREERERQLGNPLAVFVSDYSNVDVGITDEGYLTIPEESPGWVSAREAAFVINSEARTPAAPAIVPFSNHADAVTFADAHGGRILGWDALRRQKFQTIESTRRSMREVVNRRTIWANETVANARGLLDRPRTVVVGTDAPTIAAAIAAAPPNSTIEIPPGTYETTLTIEKPVTLRGAGSRTRLVGPDNGSVIRAYAPEIAVADLAISGVGSGVTLNRSAIDDEGWDYRVQMGYGYGAAGVEFDGANGSLVSGVSIDSPANGIVIRDSPNTVVDGVSTNGSTEWDQGYMGVMVMESRVVVQDSRFVKGRDGVYTHLADKSVIRDNEMVGMRFGVHEMYTSDALVSNNIARGTNIGVTVMTRPAGNLVVGNDVRESNAGVVIGGSSSYVAENLLVDNDYGMYVASRNSLYERNVVAANGVGVRATSIVPTNVVIANDFVANDRYAAAVLGPLRVWSTDGRGNYWGDAPGTDANGDGVIDRSFHATGPVDRFVGRYPVASILSTSPAVTAYRGLQDATPGLQRTGILDDAPLAYPVRPTVTANFTTDRYS